MERTTSPACDRFDKDTRKWVLDPDKAEEQWTKAYVNSEGVVRWVSSNNVPFRDMLEDFMVIGKISQETVERSDAARKKDQDEFLARYRANPPKYTEEDLFEMRAAFGEGTTVVNVLTGQKIKL